MASSSSVAATTLTSLLNSLHTHLQSQTQLLPTLHAQLGLPPSALEDELRALQEQLVAGVEKQIQKRREEVDGWMGKCEGLEGECTRYTKALAGNVKATGTTLGELRKEMALPRRYEMIAEHQEKLRQVYHTKMEQLNTITNRLNTLARTLGPDYFAEDIVEQALAPGESTADAAPNRDVSPERFLKLEKELVRGKAEVHKRLNQLSAIFVQIDWLYTELGITPPESDNQPSGSSASPAFGSSSSLARSTVSSSNVSNAYHNDDPFLESTPTPASRSGTATLIFKDDIMPTPEYEYQQLFARFVAKIDEADSDHVPRTQNSAVPIGLEGVEPTHQLLSWASALQASLEDTKRRRESHIQAMYDQLECLWRRLGVAEKDMDIFVERHRGSTDNTVREYEEELERMMELKRERMGTFVESARSEIERLWDDLMIGTDEREDFAPFADDEFTEELLTIHEDEVRRLKDERRVKAPLLAGIKKYFDICEEEKELVAAATDQSRLTGRGPRDPGRLLREEKMRKRVSKEKPRLEQDLLVSIPAWEEEAGKPFLVHGESILQILMEHATAADQENTNKRKQPRAGSVPARATTPVGSSGGYVPGAKTGVVTPAVRPSSQMGSNSVPAKRQRLASGSSGNAAVLTHSTNARPPLGAYRGGNGTRTTRVASSPAKISSKTPIGPGSTLPRPTTAAISMIVPKPGTQHHALGHGRMPTSVIYGAGVTGGRSMSATYSRPPSRGNIKSTRTSASDAIGKKESRVRRESFRPRPSLDTVDVAPGHGKAELGKRWGGGFTVREEDEN